MASRALQHFYAGIQGRNFDRVKFPCLIFMPERIGKCVEFHQFT